MSIAPRSDLGPYLGTPQVTSLAADFAVHDLAPEGVEMLSGSFVPGSPTVVVEVDAAYSIRGNARAALLMYLSQAHDHGLLYDSGGQALPGVKLYSVGSVNGESAWASTTCRRLVLEVEPGRRVRWQILAGIIGGSETTSVPSPRHIAITPGGATAFVTSPGPGLVTPIALGRPGYSHDQRFRPTDQAHPAIAVPGAGRVSAGDSYSVVSAGDEAWVLSSATGETVRRVPLGAPAQGCSMSSDGTFALVGTDDGRVVRIDLPGGDVATARPGGCIVDVAPTSDGHTAYAADASGTLLRLSLGDLRTSGEIELPAPPVALAAAPGGALWALCRPPSPAPGRLVGVGVDGETAARDYELPFDSPCDLAIVPVAEQTTSVVRTAWVLFGQGRYCEMNVGGAFAGQVHSIHRGAFPEGGDSAGGVAVNDYGEIWVTQPALDRVWRWPGGRIYCRADPERPYSGVFFGEYLDVLVYGGTDDR